MIIIMCLTECVPETFFFAEGIRGDYIFLVDEAHNLVERSREMYSAEIYKEDFWQ